MAEHLSPYDQQKRVVVATSVTDPKLHYWYECEPSTFFDLALLALVGLLFALRALDFVAIIAIIVLAFMGFRRLQRLSSKPYGIEIYRKNLGKSPNLRRGRRAAAYRSSLTR